MASCVHTFREVRRELGEIMLVSENMRQIIAREMDRCSFTQITHFLEVRYRLER